MQASVEQSRVCLKVNDVGLERWGQLNPTQSFVLSAKRLLQAVEPGSELQSELTNLVVVSLNREVLLAARANGLQLGHERSRERLAYDSARCVFRPRYLSCCGSPWQRWHAAGDAKRGLAVKRWGQDELQSRDCAVGDHER